MIKITKSKSVPKATPMPETSAPSPLKKAKGKPKALNQSTQAATAVGATTPLPEAPVGPKAEVQLRKVPTLSIAPNDYNPNEMAVEVFNQLAQDIAHDDLDQPIVVRVVDGKHVIVDGEHRWRAAVAAGIEEVYISERDMTETEAMIATVRRNSLRGSMDRVKFTDLVRKVSKDTSESLEHVRLRMGLQDREFAKSFLGMTDTKKNAAASLSQADKNVAVTMAVANLSQTIRDIVQLDGGTIPNGYISFAYKGHVHLLVSMDGPLQKAVQEFTQACKADGLTQAQLSAKLVTALRSVS